MAVQQSLAHLAFARAESDGFMDKGYGMTDVMVKAGTSFGDNQHVGVKIARYRNTANISYRGLFPDAYEAGAQFKQEAGDVLDDGGLDGTLVGIRAEETGRQPLDHGTERGVPKPRGEHYHEGDGHPEVETDGFPDGKGEVDGEEDLEDESEGFAGGVAGGAP